MTANQGPYGGGGFPPPWMPNSAEPHDDGVEWGDDLPQQDPDPSPQDNLSWGEGGARPMEAGFPPPVPEHAPQPMPSSPAPMAEPERAQGFEALLGDLSSSAGTSKSSKRGRSPKPKKERPARPPRQRKAPSDTSWRKVLIPVGALVVVAVVAGGGVVGYNALTGGVEESVSAAETPGVSRAVPPGWAQSTSWSTPADVASNLSVRNDYIAYLNSSGVLVVVDGKTGENILSSMPTGADPESARVIVTQVGGAPVVAVVQETSVMAWALDGDSPEPKVNDIPSSASVSSGGTGIMMLANGETWRMNASLGMEKVEGLPEGNTSLGLTADGSVISGSPKGGWSINNGKKSTAVKVEMAEGAAGKVMYPTRASKGFVVAWAPTSDRQTRAVGIYNAEDGTVIATTTMPTAQVNLGLPLVVSDGGKLASAGAWLIDLERGETEEVEGWGTTIGTSSDLYGKTSEGRFVWSGSGAPQAMPEDAAIPWGVTSDDKAIVISTDDEGSKVIAALNRA